MTDTKQRRLGRLIAAVLTVVMLIGLVPAAVFAAEPTAQITVGEAYAAPGSTVTLNILIDENPGIGSLLLSLEYPEVLTLTGVESGAALSGLDFTAPQQLTAPCKLLWDSVNTEATSTGILLTATFQVSNDAVPGQDYAVSVSCNRGDAANSAIQPITVTTTAGAVHIIDFLPGDVNGDGRVNGTDVSLLRRFIAGGYGTVINQAAADVNADDRFNGTDVSWIRRHITGGYDVTLKPTKPRCDHSMITAVNGKLPGCTTEGNIAHWFCAGCNQYFDSKNAGNALLAENVFVPATGHTVVVDEAVAPTYDTVGFTEGSHCSVCNTVLVEQETVDKLQPKEHAIVYKNLGGAEAPAVNSYYEHTGLIELPVPERPGYEFLGWYTSTNYRQVVNYIPKGSTQDYVLFAKWAVETYTITYFEAPENNNVTSYTTEDRIILDEPEWSGLAFTGWVDNSGNIITEIPKGSSGDLELTATWKRLRNIATEGNSKGLLATFDPENGRYYVIYELGTIEHVVLDEIAIGGTNLKYNSGASDLSFELSNSVTVSEEIADEIAELVAQSVSNSREWEKSSQWGESEENEHSVEISVTAEFGIGPVSTEISAGYGYTNTQSSSWSQSESEGGAKEDESGVEYESASTVAYMKEISSTVTTSITIERDMPTGYYSYVHAGNIRVFGIVTYDPKENTFYLDTYSVLDNMHEMMLYYRDYNELNAQTCESLSYGIPRDEILELIDNTYYVAYDANGGQGTAPHMSMYRADQSFALAENPFTREGYTFAGWALEDRTFEAGQNVANLGTKGQVVTLKALWTPITYTVQFDMNIPESAMMNVSYYPEPVQVVYDQPLMLPEIEPTLPGFTFNGWLVFPGAVEPWFHLGKSGLTEEAPNLANENGDVVSVYASWKPIEYKVNLSTNGYTFAPFAAMYVYYGETYGEIQDPRPYMTNHFFVGWYDEFGDEITADSIVQRMEDHWIEILAVPKIQTIKLTGSKRHEITASSTKTETHGLDTELLSLYKKAEVTNVKIKVEFDVDEIDDGYQEAYLWVGGTQYYANTKFETERGEIGEGSHDYEVTVPLQALINADGKVKLGWCANGSLSDDWYLGETTITFTFLY